MIVSASIANLIAAGLDETFVNAAKSIPKQWDAIANTIKGKYSTYKAQSIYGFGQVPEADENEALQYDDWGEGYTSTATIKIYKMGFKISRESFDDERYGRAKEMAGELGTSFIYTKNVKFADLFNNGFSDSYTFGDSEPLFGDATAYTHPLKQTGGTDYNRPANAGVDLTASSLVDALTDIRATLSDRGLLWKPGLRPEYLLVPPALEKKAYELCSSALTPEDANNSNNWLNTLRLKPIVNDFLTDSDAFFLVCPKTIHKLNLIQRVALETDMDTDFSTEAMLYKGYERYVFYPIDWRGTWGSPGV